MKGDSQETPVIRRLVPLRLMLMSTSVMKEVLAGHLSGAQLAY